MRKVTRFHEATVVIVIITIIIIIITISIIIVVWLAVGVFVGFCAYIDAYPCSLHDPWLSTSSLHATTHLVHILVHTLVWCMSCGVVPPQSPLSPPHGAYRGAYTCSLHVSWLSAMNETETSRRVENKKEPEHI